MKYPDHKLIAIAQSIDSHNHAIRRLMQSLEEDHPEFYAELYNNQFGTPTWAEHVVKYHIDTTKWKYENYRWLRVKAKGSAA